MKFKLILFLLLIQLHGFAQGVALVEFATGFTLPVDIISIGTSDLFVVEKIGRIKKVDANGVVSSQVFLDITDRVKNVGESGLLGLTFHPSFPDSAYIYCNYIGNDDATHISRFNVPSIDSADAASEELLLSFAQPFVNHNGGDLEFDGEGFLMIASGDGGSGGDPQNNAQNLNSLLGKILRIDVDAGLPYGIPSTNPFVGQPGVREEIWAYGLRNPWRINYDDVTNELFIGDVGQGSFEEVSKMEFGVVDPNYGWRCFEGTDTFNLDSCDGVTVIPPIFEYPHRSGGCGGSITGGVVYRENDMPAYSQRYFFADYCTGFIATLDLNNSFVCDTVYINSSARITSFGADHQGRLYVSQINGSIYRIQQATTKHSFVFTINLDGAQAGTSSTGEGYGIATYDSMTNVLTASGLFYGLTGTPTASHVHKAAAGSNGGVIFGLTRTAMIADSFAFYGSGTLSESQEQDLLAGDGFYVNIHSNVNPGGEIRGQIIRVDCPITYDAHAPELPPGEYQAKEINVQGLLTNSRSMILEYEAGVLLSGEFETTLGATLDIIQKLCP